MERRAVYAFYVADIYLLEVNEHSYQVQYLRQHIVWYTDVLLVIKLEHFRSPLKEPNCSRHPSGRQYYRMTTLVG